MFCKLTKKQTTILIGVVFFALIIIGVGTVLYVNQTQQKSHQIKRLGAAVTNGPECAVIARDIINKGGSVVDAGIAAALCEGASMSQSMGLGGGFFATIYIKDTGKVYTINARETAPQGVTADMYYGNLNASRTGGSAAAVPGLIRGFQELHKRFGVLPWKDLFQPTIKMCRSGLLVSAYLDGVYRNNVDFLKNTKSFSNFINPKTGEPFTEGERLLQLKLAETLEVIASEPDALNAGSLTKGFVQDVKGLGGIITEEDMNSYKALWTEPLVIPLSNNYTLYTIPPPGSGVVLGHILKLLSENLEYDLLDKLNNWQRILESFKFAYGMRTHLGDPLFMPEVKTIVEQMMSPEFISETRLKMRDNTTFQDPEYYGANVSAVEDHGTAHINVLSPNGDAFTFTASINSIFGAKVISNSTGIILNDQMNDFATQRLDSVGVAVATANLIETGKRPLSSMCPSVILDSEGHVRMLVGSAGGSVITTATALVILRHLYFNQPLHESIGSARMHHQLYPMLVTYDSGFTDELLDGLRHLGHKMQLWSPGNLFASVTAVSNYSLTVDASSDPRRNGSRVMI
ncbi:glutathione hydrolase 1 proenzyme-like [Atheta coriaria]|uniref:glutathione hydrolase 1 proenzyme-like n=1 Tax=Dalotia coriaria TaxID=877792 RepID=UPI0031F411C5